MEAQSQMPSQRVEVSPESLDLKEGSTVVIRKIHAEELSSVKINDELSGVLTNDAEVGSSMKFVNGAQTSAIDSVYKENGRAYIKTETSVYEIITELTTEEHEKGACITQVELDKEMKNLSSKNYREWDMFSGEVALEDNPYYLLFEKYGFKAGDEVEFFVEKIRKGTITLDDEGHYKVRDEKGNPWGIVSILTGDGHYLKKV